jgi:hypothetical protein
MLTVYYLYRLLGMQENFNTSMKLNLLALAREISPAAYKIATALRAISSTSDTQLQKVLATGNGEELEDFFQQNSEINISAEIINVMRKLGYSPDLEGVCHGIGHAAIQANMAGEIHKYKARIAILNFYSINYEGLKKDISIAKAKQNTGQKLNFKEQILATMEAWFETILIYARTIDSRDENTLLFFNEIQHQVQDINRSSEILHDEDDRIKQVYNLKSQNYNTSILEILTSLSNSSIRPASIAISSEYHTISVSLDTNNTWTYVNHNDCTTYKSENIAKLSDRVNNSFGTHLINDLQLYAKTDNIDDLLFIIGKAPINDNDDINFKLLTDNIPDGEVSLEKNVLAKLIGCSNPLLEKTIDTVNANKEHLGKIKRYVRPEAFTIVEKKAKENIDNLLTHSNHKMRIDFLRKILDNNPMIINQMDSQTKKNTLILLAIYNEVGLIDKIKKCLTKDDAEHIINTYKSLQYNDKEILTLLEDILNSPDATILSKPQMASCGFFAEMHQASENINTHDRKSGKSL